MVPNHFSTILEVEAATDFDLSTKVGCGRFTEACAVSLHTRDPRWGHLRKNPGQINYNGHAVDAVLYLDDVPGQSQAIDIIVKAEVSGAYPEWQPDIPRYSQGDWLRPTVVPSVVHTTALGASLFWAMAGFSKYRRQLSMNLAWLRMTLGADFIRAFGVLGGDLFSGHDPWEDLATNWRVSDFVAHVRDVTNFVYDEHGLKVAWTLVGGRSQVEMDMDQTMLVERFAEALAPIIGKVQYVEMWNEYLVNRGVRHELRGMARRIKTKMPAGFPIALSSPNSIMGGHAPYQQVYDEVYAMYGGDSGATLMTLHPTRPEPLWNAGTTPSLGLPIVIGEPRGPGASAGGDIDSPVLIAADYKSAINSEAAGYVYHTKAGVWGGHCNPYWPAENIVGNIYEHRNSEQIAAALKQLRETGATIPGGGTGMNPYPSEPEYWLTEFKDKITKTYEEAGQPLDDDYPVWFARTAYEIGTGLTKEASAEKHLKELREALGLPPAG